MFVCTSFIEVYAKGTDPFNWLQEDRISETGNVGEIRVSTLSVHACFLIRSMSHREECIRDISVSLLTQLRDRFPQVKVHC